MTNSLINPARLSGEQEINGPCLFFANPGDSSFIFKEAEQTKARRHHLFHSNIFEIPEKPPVFWVGPAMGAPMAVFCLEKLIALGVKKVLVFGTCGSLVENLKIGDVLIPTWCLSEEGTSPHYPIDQERPETDSHLREHLVSYLKKNHLLASQGPIWTTDAPYRETNKKIIRYGKEGIMAVDMELSALATLAHFRNIQLAAALLVSDELSSLEWVPGYKHKSFKQKRATLFHHLNKFLKQDLQ